MRSSPDQCNAPATTGIALLCTGQQWELPASRLLWVALLPSQGFPPKKTLTGSFQWEHLVLAQKNCPGFIVTGATKFTQEHKFPTIHHLWKVKSRLKSLDSEEIMLSVACCPQTKATGLIPDQGSILGTVISSTLVGRDGDKRTWGLSPDPHTETTPPWTSAPQGC